MMDTTKWNDSVSFLICSILFSLYIKEFLIEGNGDIGKYKDF